MAVTVRADLECICDRRPGCPKIGCTDEPGPAKEPLRPEFWCLAVGCDMLLVSECERQHNGCGSLVRGTPLW